MVYGCQWERGVKTRKQEGTKAYPILGAFNKVVQRTLTVCGWGTCQFIKESNDCENIIVFKIFFNFCRNSSKINPGDKWLLTGYCRTKVKLSWDLYGSGNIHEGLREATMKEKESLNLKENTDNINRSVWRREGKE